MATNFIKIGDHVIKMVYESEKVFFLKNEVQFRNVTKQIDLEITIIHEFSTPFTDYNVQITKEPTKITYRRSDYLIEVDPEYKEATLYVHDELALKHAFMNLYSSFINYHNWGLLVHSSCVIENGRAHIFSGQSGAGKSTAAKLSHPRELLSDEASILKVTDQEVTVYNSPFNSELDSSDLASAPLASIQLLHQSLQNRKESISKSDAFIHLIDKVFYWEHSDEETRRILHMLQQLVETVPVYNLHFQKNNSFWELIS
ncbi:hypothetical protein [Guptibacillus spartinae]|uniref:hypothetical protein n=1 Tax=Guptibacillus spartinae TaxID=3025679 RepID=UPI00235F6B1B|nr:hypothetical protein [Pseudalkalibacillus spartinae]